MKSLFEAYNPLKSILLIAISILFIELQSNGQQIKPSNSGYAHVNGINVYYEVYLPTEQAGGEGWPVVLLHGAFMTIEGNWGQLIPDLSKTRKVIAIELQGHGHTPYSERKLSHAALASDVEGVMDYLKIDSADLVGYSMGGSVAYKFAIQSPKRLRKLVIISSTYKSSGWLPVVNSGFKNFKPEFFDNPMPFDFGDSNIAKIAAPVLIISGDNDGLDKIELAKTYKLLGGGVSADLGPLPKSQLAIVPSQSHVSLMMQTKTILGYLNDFLK